MKIKYLGPLSVVYPYNGPALKRDEVTEMDDHSGRLLVRTRPDEFVEVVSTRRPVKKEKGDA